VRPLALTFFFLLSGCSPAADDGPGETGPVGVRFDGCEEPAIAVAGGGCLRVGVEACGEGMVEDGRGGCTANIASGCATNELALAGDSACKPIDDCGSGPFAEVTGDEPTRYVDAAATGGDGTRTQPFSTIAQAIAGLPSGGRVLLAAGTYAESIELRAPFSLIGRCSRLVSIAPTSGTASVTVRKPSTLAGLSITGPGMGVDANTDLVLRRVSIHDTGSTGARMELTRTGRASIDSVVVQAATGRGLHIGGGQVEVTRLAVRNTKAGSDGFGLGLVVLDGNDRVAGDLKISRSFVSHSIGFAMLVQSTRASVASTVLRDVSPAKNALANGNGIYLTPYPGEKASAELTLVGSLVEGARRSGIELRTGTLSMSSSVVRDIDTGTDEKDGYGVYVAPTAHATIDASVLEKAAKGGVYLQGESTLSRTVVRDTWSKPWRGAGQGVIVYPQSSSTEPVAVSLDRVLVARAMTAGVFVVGGRVDLHASTVRGTVANADGSFGDGAVAEPWISPAKVIPGSLRISDSWIGENARAGAVVWQGALAITRSSLSCNAFDLETGGQLDPAHPELTSIVSDEGDTYCGCASTALCHARSSGLEPVRAGG